MADRLKAFLAKREMTQRQLAERMGMGEQYISRLLNGRDPIGAKFIGTFAVKFGWEVAQEVFGVMDEDEAA